MAAAIARCFFDEPVQVKVAGLRSKHSSATYRADGSGEIHLDRDPSLSGSYVGVEPMGLLWSMKPDTLHSRFAKTNFLTPKTVILSVHDEDDGRMLTEVTNERFLIGNGVSRVPIKEGNICGALFMPPGGGPFPAVLDLSSSGLDSSTCLLANKGFVVLSIPVYQDNPAKVKGIHLDYFEEAIDFLKRHSKVSCVTGHFKMVLPTLRLCRKGEMMFFADYEGGNSKLKFFLIPTESGAVIGMHVLDNPMAEENKDTLIPIERAKGQFLFVASEDDLNWDSKTYMDQMVERLKRHGKDNFESVCYPGAGHVMETPYGPYCPSSFHTVARRPAMWGGEARSHAAAEVHLWKKIQEFSRTHLSCEAAQIYGVIPSFFPQN
uniref:BAAT/Acyl-CoA thioester hydrolase C-terminal domain-containing protein n=1 Tax=Acanthochromis polyacanthus TaxID=80966 RepID=A0A3Q1G2L6_9TELE